jgi:hypothetical protein
MVRQRQPVSGRMEEMNALGAAMPRQRLGMSLRQTAKASAILGATVWAGARDYLSFVKRFRKNNSDV